MENRAKIFLPFDALNGLNESLRRVEEEHENKYLNKETIISKIKKLNIYDRVEISYFHDFEYINLIGEVRNINMNKKIIRISNSIINFDDINEIKKKL